MDDNDRNGDTKKKGIEEMVRENDKKRNKRKVEEKKKGS